MGGFIICACLFSIEGSRSSTGALVTALVVLLCGAIVAAVVVLIHEIRGVLNASAPAAADDDGGVLALDTAAESAIPLDSLDHQAAYGGNPVFTSLDTDVATEEELAVKPIAQI